MNTEIPSREDNKENPKSSNGGCCIHWALNKCIPGVLSLTELNEEISEYYNERIKWDQSFKLGDAGTPDVTWHQSCIYKALIKKYGKGNFLWKKVPFHGMEHFLKTSNNDRKFYVHGKLNSNIFEDECSDGDWTHAICLDPQNNKFYDNTSYSMMKGRSIKKWFIQCIPEEQYMSEIHRVYQLELGRRRNKQRRANV